MRVAQILQSSTTYLMDTYKLYVASVLAASRTAIHLWRRVPLVCPALFNALGYESIRLFVDAYPSPFLASDFI